MPKMSSEPVRHALHGPTMGTSWQATCYADHGIDPLALRAGLQAAVDEVDDQMSTWQPTSALMRLNAAPVGDWQLVPARLFAVLHLALDIGRASGGAFDIGVGDAVSAWGFGPNPADADRIRAALRAYRRPVHELLELDYEHQRVRKRAALTLDLNGIAKGYGVDRLTEVLREHGVTASLAGIDGEMRATGVRPDGQPWTIAVEAPDADCRAAHSILTLEDAAVATSGDYRHWVEVQGQRLSHTMHPARGGPLAAPPASVSVIAACCAEADAWATALMVLGETEGLRLARQRSLDALFLFRSGNEVRAASTGAIFETPAA